MSPDRLAYIAAVVSSLMLDRGLSQLAAYRAIRGAAGDYIMGAGLPASDAADLIARICDARHRSPPLSVAN